MATDDRRSFWDQPGMGEKMENDHALAVDSLLARISLDTDSEVLDIGCGNGWLLRRVSSSIGHGVGIDKSPFMIEEASRLKGDRNNLEYHVDEWTNVADYPGNSFGLVLGIESIYWSPVQKNLNEIYRILKPGGTVGLTVEYYIENADCHGWPKVVGQSMHLHSTREYAKMLQKAGFRDVIISKAIGSRDLAGTSQEFRYRYGTLVITASK